MVPAVSCSLGRFVVGLSYAARVLCTTLRKVSSEGLTLALGSPFSLVLRYLVWLALGELIYGLSLSGESLAGRGSSPMRRSYI